jgi:cytoskeleton protein RodZ
MRVGSELKAARKKAGLTVEVVSKRTKISVSKLVALEKNDFKNLPTGLYLFSAVRAFAREVRIDPEPIVERLRAEFADENVLGALQALNAAGGLGAKNLADARSSKHEPSNLLRNAAIAAGVVLMAAAGAGAGAYLHNRDRIAHEAPTPSVSLSTPAPATTTPVDVPTPARIEEPAETPANIEEPGSEPSAPTTAP